MLCGVVVNTCAGNDLPHLLVPGEVRTFADTLYVLTYLHVCTRMWSMHVEVRGELPRVTSVLLAHGIHPSVLIRPQLWPDPECRADSWLNVSLTFLISVNQIDGK